MSDEDIPFLGDDDLDRLQRLLEAWESGRFNTSPPVAHKPQLPPIETRLAQALTDIGPLNYGDLSTSTGTKHGVPYPGVGDAELYTMDFVALDLVDSNQKITAYNLFNQKVYAGDWIILARDPGSGQYFVVFPGFGGSSSSSSKSSASSASSASGSGSGNGVVVVTHVDCGSGGLHVIDGTLTGTVNINGQNYPVTFNIGGSGS